MSHKHRISFAAVSVLIIIALIATVVPGCSKGPAWKAVNDQLIKEHNLQVRERSDLVDTGVTPSLEGGKVTNISSLSVTEFAPGVTGQMYWAKGALVNFMTMDPNTEIPKETIPGERVMIMLKGSVEQLVSGEMVPMECTPVAPAYYFSTGWIGYQHFVYLEKGAENAVKAGPNGAKFVEIYYPPRLDYITKSGATAPASIKEGSFAAKPNFPANQVLDLNDVQRTELTGVGGSWSQLVNSGAIHVSNLFMEPNANFAHHIHPEEQLMIVLRGEIDEIIMDQTVNMKEGDIVYLPGNMVHGGKLSPKGANVIDVFWPLRQDYQDKYDQRLAALNAIIPAGEKVKLVADGQTSTATNSTKKPGIQFTEGPTWMNGKLYVSSMYFDIPAGTWALDPKKSDLIVMDADGTYKYLISGQMQTNGTQPSGKGTLYVCDMAGHRIVELDPNTGKVLRVVASKLADGTRLDGPNDLVVDSKGGIYFTDPQFINDKPMRPGKTVNYMKPTGEVIEVVSPGEFGMENGLEISPDGKILYVNNCYHDEKRMSDVENWVIAYDINEDGTLANKRKFCQLFLHPTEYDLGTRSATPDGCTIDEMGNTYQATNIGVQIFNPKGEFIGMIHTPMFPVSVAFGGENFDTLYLACWDKIYTIKTNVKGLVYPIQAK